MKPLIAHLRSILITTILALFIAAPTFAMTITPVSYDMKNGESSSYHYSQINPISPGPYVGWLNSPTITFHFGSAVTVSSLILFLDDSPGDNIYLPASVTLGMGGVTSKYSIYDDPAKSAPIPVTLSNLDLIGDTLTLTLNRQNDKGWIFLSEVSFDDVTPVPEPVTILLVGPVLIGLAGYSWKKRCA